MSLLELQQDFRHWLIAESPDVELRMGGRAEPGLAVYLNNYRAQLMACLSESFAILHAWMGETEFAAAAAAHIDRVPPHSWTLDDYAVNFAETLAGRYSTDPEIVDLARLECQLGLAFTGADAVRFDVATLDGIDWEAARICFVPTFALLPVRSNAGAIWSAIRAGDAAIPSPTFLENVTVAVWRNEFVPTFRTLEDDEAEALRKLQDGASFGTVCEWLVSRAGEEQGPATAGGYLRSWLNEGMIARIGG